MSNSKTERNTQHDIIINSVNKTLWIPNKGAIISNLGIMEGISNELEFKLSWKGDVAE